MWFLLALQRNKANIINKNGSLLSKIFGLSKDHSKQNRKTKKRNVKCPFKLTKKQNSK
jgi:hypothetical protein